MRPARQAERIRGCYGAALVAVSLALLLQSLAPPGYMAGSLDDGWPVVLCPEGLPPGFLGHQGHHHHEQAAGEDLSLDGHCPLGGMLDAATALQAPAPDTDQAGYAAFRTLYRSPAPSRQLEGHPARAPPAHV